MKLYRKRSPERIVLLKRVFAMSAFAFLSQPSVADELYEFYRVKCVGQFPSFEIDRQAYWNVRHVVWAAPGDWQRHVDALKRLEQTQGLYVFDQWYGYYDAKELKIRCGGFEAVINFDKLLREEGSIGSKEPVRMHSRVTVRSSNKTLVSNLSLEKIHSLRGYSDDEQGENVDSCTANGCDLSEGVLDNDMLGRLVERRDKH